MRYFELSKFAGLQRPGLTVFYFKITNLPAATRTHAEKIERNDTVSPSSTIPRANGPVDSREAKPTLISMKVGSCSCKICN
jgi:hypothetical protein